MKRWISPAGELILDSIGGKLSLCDWAQCKKHKIIFKEGTSDVIERAISQLEEYFQGKRHTFDIPLHFSGTPFQARVWEELLTIPYGTTATYSQIASQSGCPRGVRAVANAIGANPISIFVPCHRVIGSNRALTGYAGGLVAKKILLQVEGLTF